MDRGASRRDAGRGRMDTAAVGTYRELLRQSVRGLGRDDIAVGDVVERDGVVSFTLSHGRRRFRDALPVHVVRDPVRARAALMAKMLVDAPARAEGTDTAPRDTGPA